MGDNKRGNLFSDLILYKFNKIKIILDISDGNLITANEIISKNNNVVVHVFDPKIRARKNSNNIKCYKECFYSDKKIKADLIVGMHPDEGTGEIIDWAILNKKPFAICPCCIKGKYSNEKLNKKGWLKKLKTIAINKNYNVNEFMLNMKGDNIVLI